MPTVSVVALDDNAERVGQDIENFEVSLGEVVYDGIENGGKELPHGCLAGSCGTCRIVVLEGAENLKAPSAVEQDTLSTIKATYETTKGPDFLKDKEIRLSCRARLEKDGNVTIGALIK